MSTPKPIANLEILEQFKESHPQLNTTSKILELTEERFVDEFAQSAFNGDSRKARRAYKAAYAIQENEALLWANIKDAVASPYMRDTLFNNIPKSFIEHQQSIPGYDKLFGSLDFIECKHCRSIFGPAAYFVDLLRFIEVNIIENNASIPGGHLLEDRRPDLERIILNCENAHTLIPYIDLVNKILEAVVRKSNMPDAFERIESEDFPFSLPFHLPLEEIRNYLKKLKVELTDIYRILGPVEAEIAREVLELSPREFERISAPITDKSRLDALFGIDISSRGKGKIDDVDIFSEQTGLSRPQIQQLLFLDHSDHEIQAGLSRLMFINNTGEDLGHIQIAEATDADGNSWEQLKNLSSSRLERIYRFMKLSQKLGWKYQELDWALRSLSGNYEQEKSLQFDGINDYILCPSVKNLEKTAFTLEAWVHPDVVGTHPILSKGIPHSPYKEFMFYINSDGKLGFYTYRSESIDEANTTAVPVDENGNRYAASDVGVSLHGYQNIPTGTFSHVAVAIEPNVNVDGKSLNQVKFYLNGELDSTWSLEEDIIILAGSIDFDLQIGKDLNDEYFQGSIKEIRIWDGSRTDQELREGRYQRFSGKEPTLLAYWPLIESIYAELRDAIGQNDGILGGYELSTTPMWVNRDLVLNGFPNQRDSHGFSFNGIDQYLGGKDLKGLDLEEFTLEAWVKIEAQQSHTLFCKGDFESGKTDFQLNITNQNELSFSSTGFSSTIVLPTPIQVGILTHLAVVITSSEVRMYKDGQLITVGAILPEEFPFDSEGTDFYLGHDFGDTYLNGAMQEVRIWSKPLTISQLTIGMDRQLFGFEPGLVGYWRMDETDPSAAGALDESLNKNHLSSGGIFEAYIPELVEEDEWLLPNPITREASVLTFDEEHYQLSITNENNLGLGHHEQFTLQLYFRVQAFASDRNQLLYTQGDEETGISFYLKNDHLHIYAWDLPFREEDITKGKHIHFTSAALSLNEWHQITLVYDETIGLNQIGISAWLNGISIDSTQEGFRLCPVGAAYLGGIQSEIFTRFETGMANEGTHYLDGQISDFRLWDRAFSQEEIESPFDREHSRHVPPQTTNHLLAYLPMTEGYGSNVSNRKSPLFPGETTDDAAYIIFNQQNGDVNGLSLGLEPIEQKWTADAPLLNTPTACLFDGVDDFIALPDAQQLALVNESFTIETWIKVDTIGTEMALLGCESPTADPKDHRGMYLTISPTGLLTAGFYGDDITSTSALIIGDWHHLVWRFDSTTQSQELQLNGTQVALSTTSSGLTENVSLFLGYWKNTLTNGTTAETYLNGQIADFRIWQGAIADEEIALHKNRRLSGDESGLTAYWSLDQDPRFLLPPTTGQQSDAKIFLASGQLIDNKLIEHDPMPPIIPPAFAVTLDGTDDYIDFGTVITTEGTIESWIKFDPARDQILFESSLEGNSSSRRSFNIYVHNNKLKSRLEDTDGDSADDAEINLNNVSPDFKDQWHYVALSWKYDPSSDSVAATLYLDDLPSDTDIESDGNGILPNFSTLLFGKKRDTKPFETILPFQGAINEIRIWNRQLTPAEITAQKDQPLSGTEPNLIRYFLLNEGVGIVLKDSTLNQDATFVIGSETDPQTKWINQEGTSVDVFSRVLSFEGDYAQFGGSGDLGITGSSFTIETWLYLNDTSTTSSHAVLGTWGPKFDPATHEFALYVEAGVPKLHMNGQTLVASDLVLTQDTWHHLAWKYDLATLEGTIFLDGIKSTQNLSGLKPYEGVRTLYLGYWNRFDATNGFQQMEFTGLIDDFRCWEIARLDVDIDKDKSFRLVGTHQGLKAYWTFSDEARTRFVDKVLGRSANFKVGETDSYDGKFVAAVVPISTATYTLSLDGYNDYLNLGNHLSSNDGAWTVECWFNSDKNTGLQTLWDFGGNYRVWIEEGCLQLQWSPAPTSDHLDKFYITTGTWYHLAVSYDGTNLILYKDGTELFNQAVGGTMAPSASPTLVGTNQTKERGQFFSGKIAELRVWVTARTATEISDNRHLEVLLPNSDLDAYWPMTEGLGGFVYDRSENSTAGEVISGLENPADKWVTEIPFASATASLSLDGIDDHIILDGNFGIPANQDFTLEAWIRLQSITGTNPILSGSGAGEVLSAGIKNGIPYFSNAQAEIVGTSSLTTNDWHHISWQYTAATQLLTIWVDDRTAVSGTLGTGFTGITNGFIGQWKDELNSPAAFETQYFHGEISEVRVWNFARIRNDINAQRGERLIGNETGLSAYWIFDNQHETIISSSESLEGNTYSMQLSSKFVQTHPTWTAITDHPVFQNPFQQYAFKFDGKKQYAAAQGQLSSNDITVEAWVKIDETGMNPILAKGNLIPGSPAFDWIIFIRDNNELEVTLGNGESFSGGNVPLNEWTHTAFTLDRTNSEVRLFINGADVLTGPQTLSTTWTEAGTDIELGAAFGILPNKRFIFNGKMKEVRIWNNILSYSNDLALRNEQLYHSVDPSNSNLLAYWPLITQNDDFTSFDEKGSTHLLLGGLLGSRIPTTAFLLESPPEFLDPQRKAFDPQKNVPVQIPLPTFDRIDRDYRQQRTIEVWFQTNNSLSTDRQTIYEEGDSERKLAIFLEAGILKVEGFNLPDEESGWKGSSIETDRIEADKWHHIALVLDGRKEIRDNAFCAFLDGKLIDIQPGSQLWGAIAKTNIGGYSFDPVVEAAADNDPTISTLVIVPVDNEPENVEVKGVWDKSGNVWDDRNAAKGKKSLTFHPNVLAGSYTISIKFPVSDPSKPQATNVPIDIMTQDGLQTVILDQTLGGGDFVALPGFYDLVEEEAYLVIQNKGTDNYVRIESVQFQRLAHTPEMVATAINDEGSLLQGQVLEVRVWNTARTLSQLQQGKYALEPTDNEQLIFRWDTQILPDPTPAFADDYLSLIQLPEAMEPSDPPKLDETSLQELADIQRLNEDFKLSIPEASSLIGDIRHVGKADNKTLYDQIFNPSGTREGDYWPYHPDEPLVWDTLSQSDEHREVRTRIMGALRISHEELDLLVENLGEGTLITLDENYLRNLYRLKSLAKASKLKVEELILVINLINEEEDISLNSVNDWTPSDIRILTDRVRWMNVSGIDVYEWNFLMRDIETKKVSRPYDNEAILDLANELITQTSDSLANPNTFVSEYISEAASQAIFDHLLASGEINEIHAVTQQFTVFDNLDIVALAMNWLGDFQNIYDSTSDPASEIVLQNANIIDNQGIVITNDPTTYTVSELEILYSGISVPIERTQLIALSERIGQRKVAQDRIIFQTDPNDPHIVTNGQVTTQLEDLRTSLETTVLTALGNLFDSDPNQVLTVMMNVEPKLEAAAFLITLQELTALEFVTPEVRTYLDNLYKILYLTRSFELTNAETEILLLNPEAFGFSPPTAGSTASARILNPQQPDLERLYQFQQLSKAVPQEGLSLAELLDIDDPFLSDLELVTDWNAREVLDLTNHFENPDSYNEIGTLFQFHEIHLLAQSLGTDVSYLFDLGNTTDLSYDFYRRHASSLLNLLSAQFDSDRWEEAFKPIHDELAVLKRDALTAVAMEDLDEFLTGRKSPDILYEYLLIDVQTGSEVDTSRLVQATAALQLYVQRCLMNLEKNVEPESIPMDQWQWMKNYRVWEANRKVFLYPENYIEPELRDTKTPIFAELEEELLQGEPSRKTAEAAFTRYLDKFADLTNLTIVGSYLHTDIKEVSSVPALRFNGSQSIEFSNASDLSFSENQLTIETWIKADDPNAISGIIGGWGTENSILGGWSLETRYGNLSFWIPDSSNSWIEIDGAVVADRWYHVAGTFDGSLAKLYLDGIEVGSHIITGGNVPNPTSQAYFIGSYPDNSKFFNGEIREVRIWKTARSQQEIFENMYNGVPGEPADMPANLVRYWKMDEGFGTDLLDSSPAASELSFIDLDSNADGTPDMEWVLTRDLRVELLSESEVDTVLYLVGKNENSEEFFYRELVNGAQWLPWKKIDITINSDFVSPVFAFNKLFMFWVELQDGVRTENRRVERTEDPHGFTNITIPPGTFPSLKNLIEEIIAKNLKYFDQLDVEIDEPGITNFADRFDEYRGEQLVLDKHGIIQKVNVPVQKAIVKYSYYNFSEDWTTPLEFTSIEEGINKDEKFFPKWQKVYAQRSLESFKGTSFRPQIDETNIPVMKFTDGSFIEETYSSKMDELTLSFWLYAESNTIPNLTQLPPDEPITMISYDNGALELIAKARYDVIAGTLENEVAVDTGKEASEAARSQVNDFIDSSGNIGFTASPIANFQTIYNAANDAGSDPEATLSLATSLALYAGESLSYAHVAANHVLPARPVEPAIVTAPTNPNLDPTDPAQIQYELDKAAYDQYVLDLGVYTTAVGPYKESLKALAETMATSAELGVEAARNAIYIDNPSATSENAIATANNEAIAARSEANNDYATATQTQAESYALSAISHTINALNDSSIVDILTAASTAMDEVVKYVMNGISLDLNLGQSYPIYSFFIFDEWTHIALTFNHTGSAYSVQSIINGLLGISSISLTSNELTAGNLLTIGKSDSNSADAYNVFMSECQLWGRLRTVDALNADKNNRLFGTANDLLHFPLNAGNTLNIETDPLAGQPSALALTTYLEPITPTESRERIILIYGDMIQSLRSNLVDKGFKIEEIKQVNSNVDTYSISLNPANSGENTELRIDTQPGLITERYDNSIHPLDRFHPKSIKQLSSSITTYDVFSKVLTSLGVPHNIGGSIQQLLNEYQLRNRSQNNSRILQRLEKAESYILDVHNQPGQYILETGDEQFLVQMDIDGQRLLTTEERLEFGYNNNQTIDIEAKPAFISFDRDRVLDVHPFRNPTFKFTRMNTFLIGELSDRLFGGGIDALLSLDSQNLEEKDFSKFIDTDANIARAPKYLSDGTTIDDSLDFNGAYGTYYWEIFFHIPFLVANQLNTNQNFEEAQRWYHYIFNPTAQEIVQNQDGTYSPSESNDRYWKFKPFRNLTLETLTEIITNEDALMTYREDPFDPHAIARLRINAYQKTIVMKYIDNLLDWGDFLFRQDTRESINEAVPLYILAFNLLGPRPKVRQTRKQVNIGDYRSVQQAHQDGIPDFVATITESVSNTSTTKVPFNPNSKIISSFCLVENEHFIKYWDRVEDRLYKIRHSQNIDGIFRSLALFQPPIDPAALVAAVAGGGGGSIGRAVGALNIPVPHFRYAYILEKAKEMVSTVISLGNTLQGVLESKDAEELAVLQNTHESAILRLMTNVKKAQIEQSKQSLEGLKISKSSAEERKDRLNTWINENETGLIQLEQSQIDANIAAAVLKGASVIVKGIASVTSAIPDITVGGSGAFGSPVATVKTGGSSIGKVLEIASTALDLGASISESTATIVGLKAGFERRKRDWQLQHSQSLKEIQQIEYQIAEAEIQINVAMTELQIHEETIKQNKEVADFYKRKFTNQALYNWMSGRLSGLYFQAYKMAYDMAKQAERAIQFELGSRETFVSFGHWDSRRKGLLAGESLQLDLMRMEQAEIAQNSRYLEVEKTISLLRLSPMALINLKENGECQFELSELMFDRDYPGHYLRLIKSVSISIPVIVGPYQTVKATLTQTSNKSLLTPDIEGVEYLLGESDEATTAIRADWRANQQIAISRGVNDSGMFELNFNDDQYLPFEGTGAVSTWRLEMPKSTNPIDFGSLTDVIIHLKYTAKSDQGKFRQDVKALDAVKNFEGTRVFSVAHEFAAQWYAFVDTNQTVNQMVMTLPATTFPSNLAKDSIEVNPSFRLFNVLEDQSLVAIEHEFTIAWDEEKQEITLNLTGTFDKNTSQNLMLLMDYTGENVD